jgi:hypothetical protein
MTTKSVAATIIMALLAITGTAWATPSTTYWTPDTMDVQGFLVPHLTLDNYFTVAKKGLGKRGQALPTDFGLTMGVLPFDVVNMEVGFDWFEPTDHPLVLNAKLGIPEAALFAESPGINVGLFGAGTKTSGPDRTDQDIVDVVIGKTIPYVGRLHAAYYVGNKPALELGDRSRDRQGFMIAYDRWLIKDRLMLAGDYASGKNALGGGGVGLYFFFTPQIDVLIGPVWFNDHKLNGTMKWTTQLDVNFDFRDFWPFRHMDTGSAS